MQIYPGFNPHTLEALKKKVGGMMEEQRLCAITLDEMAIKEGVTYNPQLDHVEGYEDFGSLGRSRFIANHALVIMVRGLKLKWKQTLGYFLSSGPVKATMQKDLLLQAIEKVEEVGLKPKIVIADQGSNNRSMFETHLGVTVTAPYFHINESKYFVMYDPPHLLKNVRNNLKKHGFFVGDDEVEVDWQYIVWFHQQDCKLPIRTAPKLKRKHIKLPPFASLRVKYAAQVLSHSVAAGMSAFIALGALPQEAQPTADFLDKFDQLFNCFNSKCSTSAAPLRYALSAESKHHAFLVDTLSWLKTVRSKGERALPCLDGWKMAIVCLLMLWADLHQDGTKYLLTNRLNQDCLENLFSVIRGKGGQRDNPEPLQFRTAFRQVRNTREYLLFV